MNSKQLKIFALVSMLFDHTIRIFPLSDALLPLADWLSFSGYDWLASWVLSWLPYLLSFFGRVAAPVFLFCIVQGFLHTSIMHNYLLRLFITAVLAQVPYILFDLAQNRLYGIEGNWREVPFNILFTLTLGLSALSGYAKCKEKGHRWLGFGIIVLAGVLARLLRFEGSEGYIMILFVFYATKNQTTWQKALLFIPILVLARYRLIAYTLEHAEMLRTCVLNLIGPYLGMLATSCYSNQNGKTSKQFQWFMYAFYPVHLLLLAAIGYVRTPFV